MKEKYFDIIMMVERLHRLFLDVVKVELDKRKWVDISSIQCLIIYNIGYSKLTVGEISNRGYYLGSNVTYNLKKMVESGYVIQEQALHDKRSSHIVLSDKGRDVYKVLENLLDMHCDNLQHNQILPEDIVEAHKILTRLEHFWSFLSTRGQRF